MNKEFCNALYELRAHIRKNSKEIGRQLAAKWDAEPTWEEEEKATRPTPEEMQRPFDL